MADSELTEDAVRSFLLASGGKSTNHDLVTHFKPFLSDVKNKARNRERFKEIVNTLSSVKMGDDNIKYLILKKKYHGSSVLTDSNLSLNSLLGSTTSLSELLGAAQVTLPAPSDGSNNTNTPTCPSPTTDTSAVSSQINHRAMSEPPSIQQTPSSPMEIRIEVPTQPNTDDGMSKCKSETNLRNSKVTEFRDSNSTISSSSLTSTGKDTSEHDDDSTAAFVSLTPEQKEWLVTASTGDYQAISKLLSKNPQLAKERSFINGYTALHWAAKHGKPDVVKLLCGKPGINVDQKTFVGFTPLHLASMHGHDEVIELLILTYKANPNLRDHCGKKPKQYLSSSASAKCQQILQTRTHTDKPLDEFERSEAIRKSKRVAVIGNLINSSNIMKAQPIMRSSWGGSCEDLYFDRGSGFSSHSQSPSSSRETSPVLLRKDLWCFKSDASPNSPSSEEEATC